MNGKDHNKLLRDIRGYSLLVFICDTVGGVETSEGKI